MRVLISCLLTAWLSAVLPGQGFAQAANEDAITEEDAGTIGKTKQKRAVSVALREEAILRRTNRMDASGKLNERYAAAVTRLCDLHAEIRGDERLIDSDMLQKLAIRLRRRLLDVARTLEGQLRRADVEQPAWIPSTSAAIRRANELPPAVSSPSSDDSLGAAAGGLLDNGWQLVELIQQTISPGFWDSTGGPGTIYYFALKRALVVRATSEVHADLGNTLRNLQRN